MYSNPNNLINKCLRQTPYISIPDNKIKTADKKIKYIAYLV